MASMNSVIAKRVFRQNIAPSKEAFPLCTPGVLHLSALSREWKAVMVWD